MNILGKTKVYNPEIKTEKLGVGSVMFSSKDRKSGEWHNKFERAIFIDKARKTIEQAKHGDFIFINKGFITSEEFQGIVTLKFVIQECMIVKGE